MLEIISALISWQFSAYINRTERKKSFCLITNFTWSQWLRGIFGQGQYRQGIISITSQTARQSLPPKICIPHYLNICLFRHITQSGGETMGLFYSDNKISKRWPRLSTALWSIPCFLVLFIAPGITQWDVVIQ